MFDLGIVMGSAFLSAYNGEQYSKRFVKLILILIIIMSVVDIVGTNICKIIIIEVKREFLFFKASTSTLL